MTTENLTLQRGVIQLRDLDVRGERDSRTGRFHARTVRLRGDDVEPTDRFWKSFFSRFRIQSGIFRYYNPGEVFERITQRTPNSYLRFCVERLPGARGRLLAVTNPERPFIDYDEARQLTARYDGRDVHYETGLLTSTHLPRSGARCFDLGSDRFEHRFVLDSPLDGFGHPRIHLALLREICSNGAIGYTRAFRHDVSLGKNLIQCLSRAIDSFDHPEGYAALRQRFESAQTSWASVREAHRLYKTLTRVQRLGELRCPTALTDYTRLTGDLGEIYGVASADALSAKQQRMLPVRCRVADLLNLSSELATHHATPVGDRLLQAFIGDLVGDEFDMEGTGETERGFEFQDFFVDGESPGACVSMN